MLLTILNWGFQAYSEATNAAIFDTYGDDLIYLVVFAGAKSKLGLTKNYSHEIYCL